MPSTLGFLLALPPDDPRTAEALTFLEDQPRSNPTSNCYLYCLGDGVRLLPLPQLPRLRHAGVRVLACAHSAFQRQIPPADLATFGGLGLLTHLLVGADAFEAAGPGSPPAWKPRQTSSAPSTAPHVPRRIVVTLHDSSTEPDRLAEGLRVAAGISVDPTLQVTLALAPAAVPAWVDQVAAATDPPFMEHLNLFRASGGHIIACSSTLESPPSPTQGGLGKPEVLPCSEWEAAIDNAFACLPL